jgi:hypothetical protein
MLLRVPLSRRALSLVAVAFGGALLVWQIREIGTEEIARGFAAVGVWGAVAILLLSGLRFLARSTGWTALLTTDTPPGHALGAVIAGDAAGNLTPLSMLVSEPAKAAVLAWAVPGVSTRDALAALAAETFFFGVSVALYVLLGVGALLYAYDIDPSLRLAGLVTLSAMTIALVIASWMALKRPTVVGSTLRSASSARWPSAFAPSNARRTARPRIPAPASASSRRRRSRFTRSVLSSSGSRCGFSPASPTSWRPWCSTRSGASRTRCSRSFRCRSACCRWDRSWSRAPSVSHPASA